MNGPVLVAGRRSGPPIALVVSALMVLVAVVATDAATAQPDAEEEPLRAAGRAAEKVSFLGVLKMRWADGNVEHDESLLVEGANGAVMVRGGSAAMASPRQRLVQHDGEWDLLWPVPTGGGQRPSARTKYEVSASSVSTVGGRPARVIEFRDEGVLLERLFLDLDTGLLLRREQFEAGTRPSRTIAFETVTIPSPSASPRPPRKVVNAAAASVPPDRLPSGVSAPPSLPESYQRLGIYRRSGVTQVLYSDGLYDLSVFQEEGRLDRSELPKGEKVTVGKRSAWHFVWPGGHVVVWEARGVVHTAVSDAPFGQVMTAIRSLPPTGGSDSLVRRLRQVCRALVQPLG
jgi:hypothetical protein